MLQPGGITAEALADIVEDTSMEVMDAEDSVEVTVTAVVEEVVEMEVGVEGVERKYRLLILG